MPALRPRASLQAVIDRNTLRKIHQPSFHNYKRGSRSLERAAPRARSTASVQGMAGAWIYVAWFKQKKPLMGSVEGVSGRASSVAAVDISWRSIDHWNPRPPCVTWREPTTKSAVPLSTGTASAGTDSGSCWRSASMHSTVVYLATAKPSSTALDSPRPSALCRACTCTAYSSDASLQAMALVAADPGDSSSTMSSSTSRPAARVAAKSRSVSGRIFGASSNAGTTTLTALAMCVQVPRRTLRILRSAGNGLFHTSPGVLPGDLTPRPSPAFGAEPLQHTHTRKGRHGF